MARVATLTLMVAALGLPGTVSAANNWLIDETSKCRISTPALTMDDGQGDTQVQLVIEARRLLVKTQSNVDAEFGDLGISVDNKPLVLFDDLAGETDVVFERHIDTLIQQFIAGRDATVHLRFWPTWPSTGVKRASFSLIGFTAAHKSMSGCE